MKSIYACILITIIWVCLGAFYYPKWDKQYSEAAISWDVAGYYHYLPAIFIYKDLKQQLWIDKINETYLPSPAYDQSFVHPPSGNKVNKRTIGQAILYAPFFLIAHAYAQITDDYPADGYSKPYQFTIWLGGLIISCLGLILLRKILLIYFDDTIVAWTLISLALGSHWMEYASISNGMNHTWLFTLLTALIRCTIRFYQKTDWLSVFGIGVLAGLIVLTRPPEMVMMLIPLLWAIGSVKDRYRFLLKHWYKVAGAVMICGLIVSIQLIYWKYVAGEWLVRSYGDQHFEWLHPSIWRGLMGVNVGWWIFTPIMFLTMFGWFRLYKIHKPVFWVVCITSLLAIYVTLSWPYWETGGGLGQRNLIQVYPLLAFPLACVISWMYKSTTGKWIWIAILLCNIYYNAWWTWQAHHGGFFMPGQMNTNYFYRVVGRPNPDRDFFKLLDTKEYFSGTPRRLQPLWENDFESDSLDCQILLADSTKAACLNQQTQVLGPFTIPVPQDCRHWIRLEADFNVQSREWDVWKYAQWIVQFYNGDTVIKTNLIRVQRLIPDDYVDTYLFFDVAIPVAPYDRCVMTLNHIGSASTLMVDNLRVSCLE